MHWVEFNVWIVVLDVPWRGSGPLVEWSEAVSICSRTVGWQWRRSCCNLFLVSLLSKRTQWCGTAPAIEQSRCGNVRDVVVLLHVDAKACVLLRVFSDTARLIIGCVISRNVSQQDPVSAYSKNQWIPWWSYSISTKLVEENKSRTHVWWWQRFSSSTYVQEWQVEKSS